MGHSFNEPAFVPTWSQHMGEGTGERKLDVLLEEAWPSFPHFSQAGGKVGTISKVVELQLDQSNIAL